MKPSESVKAFEDFASAKGIDLRASTPRAGIQAILEFQAEVTCAVCSEDMLLYEWGTYDWGSGKYFELTMTRQFIETELEDDDAISQLTLVYQYIPRSEMETLGLGNHWQDGPGDFRQFIFASASFNLVADAMPDQVELSHSFV